MQPLNSPETSSHYKDKCDRLLDFSLCQNVNGVDRVHIAAIWVAKAAKGSVGWADDCSVMQLMAQRLKWRLGPVTSVVKCLFLALAVFERPSYCVLDARNCPGPQRSGGWTGGTWEVARPDMYGSGIKPLSPSTTHSIAICFWLYFVGLLFLRRTAKGVRKERDVVHVVGVVLVACGLMDCLAASRNGVGILYHAGSSFRISWPIRPLLVLCLTKSVRTAAKRVVLTIPKFADILLALAIAIFFFVWLGIVLFADTAESYEAFSGWIPAVSSLWILFTTCNSPDVFIPVYNLYSVSFLFFFVFMILMIYLLNNVLLASVYGGYKEILTDGLKTSFENRKKALEYTFNNLKDAPDGITAERWSVFFTCMCHRHDHIQLEDSAALKNAGDTQYNKTRANAVFKVLDKDGSGILGMNEFKEVIDVFHDPEKYVPLKPAPVKWNQDCCIRRNLHALGTNCPKVDALVDCVIFVDVAVIFFQTLMFVKGDGEFNYDVLDRSKSAGFLFSRIQVTLLCFYVLMVSLKIMVLGMERFWYTDPFQNRFDFFNVYGCLIAWIASFFMHDPMWVLRIILLLHITRAVRLLRYVEPLVFVCRLVVYLAPTYMRILEFLLVVFYVYAMVGMQVYGGLIYEGNPALEDSDFADLNYWKLNFNDFNNSMVTLFVMMVVNNWHVLFQAFAAVSGHYYMSAVFCVTFFVIVNMTVVNIMMALILDCSTTIREMGDGEGLAEERMDMLRRVLLDDTHGDDGCDAPSSDLAAPANGSVGYGTMDGRSVAEPQRSATP